VLGVVVVAHIFFKSKNPQRATRGNRKRQKKAKKRKKRGEKEEGEKKNFEKKKIQALDQRERIFIFNQPNFFLATERLVVAEQNCLSLSRASLYAVLFLKKKKQRERERTRVSSPPPNSPELFDTD
jgi:hypothetical protein